MNKRKLLVAGAALVLAGSALGVMMGRSHGSAIVRNDTPGSTLVYVAFGADSVVRPADWKFCHATGPLTCDFPVAAGGKQELPLAGRYLNATLAFGAPVACGATKAELNLNNPAWYDVTDVSLVDGYSNMVRVTVTDPSGTKVLGPPLGASGNEKVYGVFPLGCDVCTAREHPPCGMVPGKDGCKAGSQYKPDVPCQHQGAVMGGGSKVEVALVAGVPAL